MIAAFFASLSWRAYALIGVLVVVAGLAGTVYVQSLRLDAAGERVKTLETKNEELGTALQQSEDDKKRLLERQHLTDALVKQLAAAKVVAEKAKKDADQAYAKLRSEVDAQNQACLDLPVPDGLAVRLRD